MFLMASGKIYGWVNKISTYFLGGRCEVNILKNGNEEFVKGTINTVLGVNDFFKWGNRNILLHEIAAQHKLQLHELSSIPDTRMANYTGKIPSTTFYVWHTRFSKFVRNPKSKRFIFFISSWNFSQNQQVIFFFPNLALKKPWEGICRNNTLK